MMLAMALVNDADEDAQANEATHRDAYERRLWSEKRHAETVKFHEQVMDPCCHTNNANVVQSAAQPQSCHLVQ